MKKTVKVAIAVISVGVVSSFIFQNCSQPGTLALTDPYKEQREAEQYRLAVGADDETVTIGLNPVPDLKMFFVVDNSGTMSENQFNLSESFGSMFDANSSESLAKFDATTFLINTAQRSPAFASEKAVLAALSSKQKSFDDSVAINSNIFNLNFRTSLLNTGAVPGDNIGFQVKQLTSPLRYQFQPAVVQGAKVVSDDVTFSSGIRKLASESASVMESEFKSRLALMNSERIPLEQVGANLKPEYASIVDEESGLCSVARVLRNPEKFIKSGDLVSFTIVSDENDNDPKGLNCVQSVTENTGAFDIIDGRCTQRETSIKFQTSLTTQGADTCKLNGKTGYNYLLTYPVPTYTTNVTYKALDQAAVYTAPYSEITYQYMKTPTQYRAPYTTLNYKVKVSAYSYRQTEINYYVEKCVDIISDGLVVGQRCSVDTVRKSGKRDGDYTADCYGLAKSIDGKAVNLDPYKPSCTISYRPLAAACNANDANCKESITTGNASAKTVVGSHLTPAACLTIAQGYADFYSAVAPTCTDATKTSSTVCSTTEAANGCAKSADPVYSSKIASNVLGYFETPTACENKAKTFSDYVASSTASICNKKPKDQGSCSSSETAAGCFLKSAETTKSVSASPSGDKTANNCVDWAKTQSNNRVSSAADIIKCEKITGSSPSTASGVLAFSEIAASVDNGATLAVNADCGAVTSLAVTKSRQSNSGIPTSATCKITAINSASEVTENKTSDCTTQANNRCVAMKHRSCVGTLVAGSSTTSYSAVTEHKKVKEQITCNTLCSESKMQACGADAAVGAKVSDYLKTLYGNTASCTATTSNIANTQVAFVGQPLSEQANLCQPTMTGVPTYLEVTKAAYRSVSVDVDYVVGTVKDDTGKNVPAMGLIDYIKARSDEINKGQVMYSAIVRTATDGLGQGGTVGVDYEKLVQQTNGQLGSVLANDYSLVLKDLSKVIKANIERTILLKKMQAHQVVKKVLKVSKTSQLLEEVDPKLWKQNGASVVFNEGVELRVGEQYKIEFANF